MLRLCATACLCLVAAGTAAQQKTVIGPSNPELHDGAQALLAGDAKEGVQHTLQGLATAANTRERMIGMSNLCAGYIMLKDLDTALDYCNRVLAEDDKFWRAYSNRALIFVTLDRYDEAEADLEKAEAISPNSRTVKIVRSMLRDKTKPVRPNIVIDDRRRSEGGDED
jgi:tetratricopeptide (TPR) repeat protein